MLLDVRGSVAQIESAFHVNMRVYPHPEETRTFFAPDTEPSVEFGGRVLQVSGLNNYTLPHPRSLRENAMPQTAGAVPRAGSGPNGEFIGRDFRTVYVPGTALSGMGQSVGLFELDGYYSSDISQYEAKAGLPSVPLQNVLIDGFTGTPTGRRPGSGNEEVALDIEMAISMAPGLDKVLIYEGPPTSTTANINDVLNRMATDNLAKQLSCSWGFDIDTATEQIFQQFAVQGQSFFLASGDSGAFVGPVFQPSDNPYITVVGGTTLTTSNAGAWASEVVWSGSSGGFSTVFEIPEWQQGIDMSANLGSTTMRNLPDVAMIADNVLAISDRGRSSSFSGTSIAAPLWAGLTALINEQAAATGHGPVGFLNPAIYALGKSAHYTNYFHDITVGSNASDADPASFPAVTGYDLCTGWGTPSGTKLINALLEPLPGSLIISPPLGFVSMGAAGGPFSVRSQTYTLTNMGSAPIEWTLSSSAAWLDVSPASGTLAPGGPATTVTVQLSAAANSLLLGQFDTSIQFTDVTHGVVQSRDFSLLVGNGGFETGDFTTWTLSAKKSIDFVDSVDTTMMAGGSTIPGLDDSLFVHSGIYGAFLGQSGSLGSLSKTLPTVVGQQYTLSFWLDNPAPGTPNQVYVSWNGTAVLNQSDLDQFAWTNLQYVVTATTTSTVLMFQFRNDQNAFGLDDVSVEATPPLSVHAVPHVDGTVSLNWPSTLGSVYQVQYTDDLGSGNWTTLGDSINGSDTTLSISDPIATTGRRFYRVVVLPSSANN
jgi:hypothetical protein